MTTQAYAIFGLTIFLTISTLLIMVAVVCIALYARKLRKKIESEFLRDSKLVQNVTVRKRNNKYTPSVHKQSGHELSFYESPPLTNDQRERLKQKQAVDQMELEGHRKDLFLSMKYPKHGTTDSYKEVINDGEGVTPDYVTHVEELRHGDSEDQYIENFDDLAPHYIKKAKESVQNEEDELYTEAHESESNDDVFLALELSRNPVTSRPDHVTQHHKMRRQPRLPDSVNATKQGKQKKSTGPKPPISKKTPSQSDVTQCRDPVTQAGSNTHIPKSMLQRLPEGPTASKSLDNRKPTPNRKPLKPMKSRVTQQIVNSNASNTSTISYDRTESRFDGRENTGFAEHDNDELYGNHDVIQAMSNKNTGIPTLEDDQEIIDEQRNQFDGNTNYEDEQLYGNQDIIEMYQPECEIYENYNEGQNLYENYDTST